MNRDRKREKDRVDISSGTFILTHNKKRDGKGRERIDKEASSNEKKHPFPQLLM